MSGGRLTPPVSQRDHAQGDATAAVTLVEYGDFECPHCGRAFPIVERVRARLGSRLRFVFRHFPLSEAHPHAEHAAEAAEAVAAQVGEQAFWAMHDLIFQHQSALSDANLAQYGAKAGGNRETVLHELQAERYRDRVSEDFRSGVRSGVNGTPTFFIDGQRYNGSWDEESLVQALEIAARIPSG